MTQLLLLCALLLAILLALSLNPKLLIRPNVVLSLSTALGVTSWLTSLRGTAGAGAMFRCARLTAFLLVLWLLTPWWGRRDMLLARCHLRALLIVCATVVVGLVVAPGAALGGGGRLVGILWPIPAPQVGEYAAVAAGISIALWLSGDLDRRRAMLIGGGGLALVLMSQTRTALTGLFVGVSVAALSLFISRRRVRRMFGAALLMAPMILIALAPALSVWFTRGQTGEQLGSLTGRKAVWEQLLAAPRSEFVQWFGSGLSDKSFGGRPIDSTWLAVYHEQGLVGDFIIAAIIAFLLIAAAFRPAGAGRTVAVFIAVYCAVASYTEVGFGDASPYLLHIVVAASLIVSTNHRRELVTETAP